MEVLFETVRIIILSEFCSWWLWNLRQSSICTIVDNVDQVRINFSSGDLEVSEELLHVVRAKDAEIWRCSDVGWLFASLFVFRMFGHVFCRRRDY
jgi:hypothetical protein